jgi:hypothetical protein
VWLAGDTDGTHPALRAGSVDTCARARKRLPKNFARGQAACERGRTHRLPPAGTAGVRAC